MNLEQGATLVRRCGVHGSLRLECSSLTQDPRSVAHTCPNTIRALTVDLPRRE